MPCWTILKGLSQTFDIYSNNFSTANIECINSRRLDEVAEIIYQIISLSFPILSIIHMFACLITLYNSITYEMNNRTITECYKIYFSSAKTYRNYPIDRIIEICKHIDRIGNFKLPLVNKYRRSEKQVYRRHVPRTIELDYFIP